MRLSEDRHGLPKSRAMIGHKAGVHLDTRSLSIGDSQVEKGIEPLCLAREEKMGGDSRRPSWSLGLQQQHLKYYKKRALKRLLNLKPSIAILGSSHTIIHVILWLTDA